MFLTLYVLIVIICTLYSIFFDFFVVACIESIKSRKILFLIFVCVEVLQIFSGQAAPELHRARSQQESLHSLSTSGILYSLYLKQRNFVFYKSSNWELHFFSVSDKLETAFFFTRNKLESTISALQIQEYCQRWSI